MARTAKPKVPKPAPPTDAEIIAALTEENALLKRHLQSATECFISGCMFCANNDDDRKRRPQTCSECRRLPENKRTFGLSDNWTFYKS